VSTTIYHNPRCTKSRLSLDLLRNKGIEPEIVEYLNKPPSTSELKSILTLLGINARAIIRDKEPEYTERVLSDTTLTEDQIIQILVDTPKLIERPIVVHNGKATIGRPPENILEIL